MASPNHRRFVRLDAYALSDIGRKYGLTVYERLLLVTLACLVDFRARSWRGTFLDLAAAMGCPRRAATDAVAGLEKHGLIVATGFGRGKTTGHIDLLAYEDLVVPTASEIERFRAFQDAQESSEMSQVCTYFVPTLSSVCAEPHKVNGTTRDDASTRGGEAVRDGGVFCPEHGEGDSQAPFCCELQIQLGAGLTSEPLADAEAI